ncbi:UvrD-helicase domain-containing protein [Marilutibacter spongiae]|uniref:RecBCD enzyme subunit RecB n=1 Tax=Marilutibacter spongiae TaxID=2025720 RepID=A0A7W3TP58_9GAMM|nr:exodeoxyribonuclease V subunit beta [Lysobacter spongiae]MBB1061594.1 UvrD-helicase domain-containing protein [Lysobacter spongiae]
MNEATRPDPWLDLTLEGVHLVEASAGTGKTYTLATLVARLVVERGLRVGAILAVTFTEAATQELRARIRERLQLAVDQVDAPPSDADGPAATLTRDLLERHLARSGEPVDALRRRLRQAVMEIDLAAIFTIHGFCARVLREHALESGQGFDPPELLGNDRALREALAADLWRALAVDADSADDLASLWKAGPEALAADLRDLLREPVLLPPPMPVDAAERERLQALTDDARQALRDAWAREGEAFVDTLVAAVADEVLKLNIYKTEWLEDLRGWMREFASSVEVPATPHPKLAKLTADALAAGTKKGRQVPTSPTLSTAASDWLDATQALDGVAARRRATLLHRLRDEARVRLAEMKRQGRVQTYDDLIDGVANALDGPNGDRLAARLREQYAVALVDEFQDTDTRQWRIFDRVFGHGSEAPALYLVGDPKQAIYGFRGGDVHTYLAAAAVAAQAPPLSRNYRSRPSVLAAIDALYAAAGARAFVDERIAFHPVTPGGHRGDADYLRQGAPAPALTVWLAPPQPPDDKGRAKPWSAEDSRAMATRACVAAIHAVLSEGRAGSALIDGRPVRPGDIAVLVRSHAEATRVQRALAEAGIAAVAAGKQSLYATPEARELHALLLALLHGGDDGRLRAALSTVLLGVDAAGIDALDHDADAARHWQAQAQAWRERLARGGPLALVGERCADAAERLLGLPDGERRLSNYLQLAEALQEMQARSLGLHGLVDAFARRIASADDNDESQLLRLESDAHRVQIVTLHKSKGLEYPLVYLPFVGVGGKTKSPGQYCVAHDGDEGRRLHWHLELPEAGWKDAKARWQEAERAEDARLLYVGLTRAEHALWLAAGPLQGHDKAPAAAMLGDLDALADAPGIVIDTRSPPPILTRLPAESDADVPLARTARRRLDADWWVYSFTQLAHADGGSDASAASTEAASGGQDEPPPEVVDEDAFDPRFAGTRFGVALHAALEDTDFAAWRDWRPGDAAPAGEDIHLARALESNGYAADAMADGMAFTAALAGHTLTVPLPEGLRLCDLAAADRRAEIEFQFALAPTRVDVLLALLHAHGVVRDRQGFGLRQRLEGLMTGLIDLTYRHEGRWYVLDYKSNRLPRYDAGALEAAMAHSEYDLQALIYTLALHRWLRFRLGPAYDYARDFGGIRYLFCRGLDARRDDSPGIHARRFAPDLVDALDALFGHADAEAAA